MKKLPVIKIKMDTINISRSMLEWAAVHAGTRLEELAERVAGQRSLERFLNGDLTPRQAEKLAHEANIPFGFLFLDEPPEIETSIPDLRQAPYPTPLTDDFRDTYDDIQNKIQWYQDYKTEHGIPPCDFVNSFDINQTSTSIVASAIKTALGVTNADRSICKTYSEYFSYLSEKAESIGILVFKNGVVRLNNRRQLSVSEFRGFAIADKLVPAVFINGQDAESAWIFTLIHELAHIWIGASGVSDTSVNSEHSINSNIEKFCNQTAADFLTPRQEFIQEWDTRGGEPINELARFFKVSRLVIARRALDFNLITKKTYQEIAAISMQKKKSSGGNFFAMLPVKNSKKLTSAIVSSAMTGRTMLREAGSLLNIKPDSVVALSKRLDQK
ncbi:ImmA/IrrE family metallo-endopeptidase [Chromobacterium amazonense]|nr:ImmA/IrrE family metallo-endopeptidase [Chromobacterium amazonense]